MPGSSTFSFSMQTWWLLAAGGVVLVAVLALLAWLIIRTPRAAARQRSAPIGLAEQRNLERDIGSLMNELAAMTSQVGRHLDTRAARLEQLIRAADERIEQLRTRPTPTAPRHTESAEADPRDLEIYQLSDQGLAPREIAQRLARPAGEIELILALRPHQTGDVA